MFLLRLFHFFNQLKQCLVGDGDIQSLKTHTHLTQEFKFSYQRQASDT